MAKGKRQEARDIRKRQKARDKGNSQRQKAQGKRQEAKVDGVGTNRQNGQRPEAGTPGDGEEEEALDQRVAASRRQIKTWLRALEDGDETIYLKIPVYLTVMLITALLYLSCVFAAIRGLRALLRPGKTLPDETGGQPIGD